MAIRNFYLWILNHVFCHEEIGRQVTICSVSQKGVNGF